MSARILFHPRCFARRAAEIAQSQGATVIERDRCGRPFIVPSGDPLAPPAPAPSLRSGAPADPVRFERLRRALEALAAWLQPIEEPGRRRPAQRPVPR